MKYGVRTPNIKKSIKASTTGKVKRQIKKAVNPLYGKKGMGIVNDPKKAAYNAVYNRTTVGVSDVVKSATSGSTRASASRVPTPPKNTSSENRITPASRVSAPLKREYSDRTYNVCGIILMVLSVVLALFGLLLLIAAPIGGIVAILLSVGGFSIGLKYRKIVKERSKK